MIKDTTHIRERKDNMFIPNNDYTFCSNVFTPVEEYSKSFEAILKKDLAVKKIELFPNEESPRAMVVTFISGGTQKAVVQEGDVFDYDTGLAICLFKQLLHVVTKEDSKRSNYMYGKLIKNAIKADKVYRETKKMIEEIEAEDERKRKKTALKRAKRKAKAINLQIEIQKQAILRAEKGKNEMITNTEE